MIFDAYLVTLDATIQTEANDRFLGIWGIGERITSFFYKDGIYSTFSRDAATPYDTGVPPGNPTYGVHPIYMAKVGSE